MMKEQYSNINNYNDLRAATVSINFGNNEIYEFNLDDLCARKVLGFTAFTKNSLNELIEKWAKTGKWSCSAVKRVTEQINTALIETFSNRINDPAVVETIANDITKIISFKESNQVFYNFINDTKSNIFDVFKIPGVELLNDYNFLSALCQIDFAENKVSVGPGEVAITLFTEATNPKKGDLHIESLGEIELKGSLGRIGKGEIERVVHRDVITKIINTESIEQMKKNLFNQMQDIKRCNENRIVDFKNITRQSKIFKVLDCIYNTSSIEEYISNSNNSQYFTEGERDKLINTLKNIIPKFEDENLYMFKTAAKQLIELSYKIYSLKVGKETRQFKTFFSTDIVNEDIKLQTIFKYVNTELTDSIKDLISEFYSKTSVESIIGSITIANYQQEENFKYIVFANTSPEVIQEGSLPCKVIGSFTNNYEDNLRLMLNNVDDLSFRPNADRGGFQVQYKGTIATD